jgi:hypothetical protein
VNCKGGKQFDARHANPEKLAAKLLDKQGFGGYDENMEPAVMRSKGLRLGTMSSELKGTGVEYHETSGSFHLHMSHCSFLLHAGRSGYIAAEHRA